MSIFMDPISRCLCQDSCSLRGEHEGIPWEVEVLLWVNEFGASFGIVVRLEEIIFTYSSLHDRAEVSRKPQHPYIMHISFIIYAYH